MSIKDGPGEGTWSVFAQKVVEERDAAREEVARLRAQRDDLLSVCEATLLFCRFVEAQAVVTMLDEAIDRVKEKP